MANKWKLWFVKGSEMKYLKQNTLERAERELQIGTIVVVIVVYLDEMNVPC